MISPTGLTAEQAPAVLNALGYRQAEDGQGPGYIRVDHRVRRPRKQTGFASPGRAAGRPVDPASPFAALQELKRPQ